MSNIYRKSEQMGECQLPPIFVEESALKEEILKVDIYEIKIINKLNAEIIVDCGCHQND